MNYKLPDLITQTKLPQLRWLTAPDQQQKITEERQAAIRQLAGGVAHHFNNSLQTIMGYAELASRNSDLPDSVRENMSHIIEEAKTAAQLSYQLLDFSGQSIERKQVINPLMLIEETIDYLKYTTPDNIESRLQIDPECNAYRIPANPEQIQQALSNIIVNGNQSMPDGGVLEIRLSLLNTTETLVHSSKLQLKAWQSSVTQWIVLAVSDTGTGIEPSILPYIFEPFFTTKDIGQGSGLGLAQAQGIIKQHGGKIEVESQAGWGTTVYLYLPALPVS